MTLQSVDDSSFDGAVLQSPIPVIVLFSDANKNSSKNMILSLQAAAQDQGAAVQVLNKAFDKNGHIEKDPAYDVQSAPTTLLFKGGRLVARLSGFMTTAGFSRPGSSN